ncbi:thermonuclease family protein [Brevirhabdus sp.]|uniref:thermonuclease family protein n=1 Tax=Brevirhabdus sp. TaxID=2004514 RepID=UPI004059DD46
MLNSIFSLFTLALLATAPAQSAWAAPDRVSGRVRVIDADTFVVDGHRIRLFGVDAPELAQTCRTRAGKAWACGQWSSDQMRRRFGNKRAECRVMDVDRYDRLVARCVVGRADVAEVLVREGWGFAYSAYSADYVDLEKRAAVENRGLWAGEWQRPDAFRRARREQAEQRSARNAPPPPASGCRIKGNISKAGRIYHMPGDADYDRTRISTRKGERWFCTAAQADAAGWRRARR